MSKILCHYTIVRYVPDLIRNEGKNIGVIVFNERDKACIVRFPDRMITHKIGADVWRQNKKIISLYLKSLPDSRENLMKWADMKSGVIQFSDVKSLVTEDIDSELNYLLKVYIDEPIQEEKKPLFKSALIRDLRKNEIVGRDKFTPDKEIKTGKSNVTHKVDLAYENGKLHVVEAVDLSRSYTNGIYQSACIFQDLKRGMENKITTISAVKMPAGSNSANALYQLLDSTSDKIFDISNGQDLFLKEMKKILNGNYR